jgi:hypothetical protein
MEVERGLSWPWSYHHWCCEFESRSGRGVQHYVIVCQWLATGWRFSPGPPVSSNNKTDHHELFFSLVDHFLPGCLWLKRKWIQVYKYNSFVFTMIQYCRLFCLFVWWCLMPLSTLFQLYRGGQFYCWRKPEDQEKTANLSHLYLQLK